MNLNSTLTALRLTAGAVLGRVDDLFDVQSVCYRGVLVIDTDAVTPGSTELLQRGQRREALVRIGNPGGGTQAIGSVSVKLPDVYGPGRDQDFLLASSGDGAPLLLRHAAGDGDRPHAVLVALALPGPGRARCCSVCRPRPAR